MSKTSVRELFLPHADPKGAAWQHAYMREQFPFLGVKKPLIAPLLKPIAKGITDDEILKLWQEKEREFQYAAMWLLRQRAKTVPTSALSIYERLIREKSWWDTVDEISAHLVGSLVLRYPDLHRTLDTWRDDPHLWIRRSSIIYQLRFKEHTDASRLFSNCLHLAKDSDFFIRKAIGWALREYSKTHPQEVRAFLNKHSKQLSPLSVREAQKYI